MDKIIDKLLSGRFIFTVIAAFVFAVLSLNKTLSIDKVMEVVLIIIYAYFNRGDRNGTNPKGGAA